MYLYGKWLWLIYIYRVEAIVMNSLLSRYCVIKSLEYSINRLVYIRWRELIFVTWPLPNHRKLHCLMKSLFTLTTKKSSEVYIIGPLLDVPSVTGEFPSERASNAENVAISWCDHGLLPSTFWIWFWCLKFWGKFKYLLTCLPARLLYCFLSESDLSLPTS